MSTKTASKTKKDRPKSTDKFPRGKRGQTPDQGTDSEGRGDDDAKQVKTIINDEILALQIKQEDLDKLRESFSPEDEPERQTVTVRRKLSPSQIPPRRIKVNVAKPAPRDAPLKKIIYDPALVPRVGEDGKIVAHSLLGSIDDYLEKAEKRGTLPDGFVPIHGDQGGTLPMAKRILKHKEFPQYTSADQSSALKNWQKHMTERRYQQHRLSKLVKKHPADLVMNESDAYRAVAEERHLIDRALNTLSFGKGKRVGSEFWAQPEILGEEDNGMRMTLTQTEKGYPPPIEHVGNTWATMYEKGIFYGKNDVSMKPWHKSDYLSFRQWQLGGVMKELYSYKPEINHLQIIGKGVKKGRRASTSIERGQKGSADNEPEYHSEGEGQGEHHSALRKPGKPHKKKRVSIVSDPFPGIPDVEPEQVMGPSILFANQPARWTGNSQNHAGKVGIDARVSFEIFAGKRIVSFLDISNDGTTAIQYAWKKVHRPNPFQLQHNNVQRFYFNTTEGTILPGDSTRIPFVFKSPNAGVFQEQWEVLTKPVLCGGAKLLVTLRGVALQEDTHGKERSKVEINLQQRQVKGIVEEILHQLVDSIQEPARPPSPVDAYVTDERHFQVENPTLYYHYELVQELKTMFSSLTPDPENYVWDFSVDTIQGMIMEIDEENEEKQDLLDRFNTIVAELNYPPRPHENRNFYTICYQGLSEFVDRFVNQAVMLQQLMGLPERVASEFPTDVRKKSSLKNLKIDQQRKASKDIRSPLLSKTGISAAPSTSGSLTSLKSGSGGSKVTLAKPEFTREDTIEDTVNGSKYKEILLTESYVFLCEAIDGMCQMFAEQDDVHGGPILPKMVGI